MVFKLPGVECALLALDGWGTNLEGMILQSPGVTCATGLRVTAGAHAGGMPRMRPMRCPTLNNTL
jgi:hypothetical protein